MAAAMAKMLTAILDEAKGKRFSMSMGARLEFDKAKSEAL
jgi:hypothetical protein